MGLVGCKVGLVALYMSGLTLAVDIPVRFSIF